MVDKRNERVVIKRGILGKCSGSVIGLTFGKNGIVRKKTSLNKFSGQKYLFRIYFRKNPDGKLIYTDKCVYNCYELWQIIIEQYIQAVFIKCVKLGNCN